MAVTASIALSSAALQQGQQCVATLTVSNSGGSDVVVTDIQPTLSPATAAAALGRCPFGGAQPSTVAASGSTKFYFPVVGLGPQLIGGNPPQNPSTFVISVGATVYANDGSIVAATPSNLTVSGSVLVI